MQNAKRGDVVEIVGGLHDQWQIVGWSDQGVGCVIGPATHPCRCAFIRPSEILRVVRNMAVHQYGQPWEKMFSREAP